MSVTENYRTARNFQGSKTSWIAQKCFRKYISGFRGILIVEKTSEPFSLIYIRGNLISWSSRFTEKHENISP